MLPREEAAHWVEHVLRFGSRHLRPVTMDMAWYELLSLDVAAALLSVPLCLALLCGCLCRAIFCRRTAKAKED